MFRIISFLTVLYPENQACPLPEEESEMAFAPLCIFQPELVEIQGCLRMKPS
jgi:hypothetical protein